MEESTEFDKIYMPCDCYLLYLKYSGIEPVISDGISVGFHNV